jgi:uncharacterized membrane protein SirB2
MARAILTTLVFVVFTVYSFGVIAEHGLWSVLDVATQGGWSTQVFLDLCIAITVSTAWMRNDARQKQLTWWPFALGSVVLGSIAVLAYATWSAWVGVKAPNAVSTSHTTA